MTRQTRTAPVKGAIVYQDLPDLDERGQTWTENPDKPGRHSPPTDAEVLAALTSLVGRKGAGGRGRRSPLAVWLTRNREAFARLIVNHAPRWDALAAELAAKGVLAGDGKPPSGDRLRKTWWAINRPRGAVPKRRRPGKPPSPDLLSALVIPPPAEADEFPRIRPKPTAIPLPADARPVRTFAPVKAR